MKHLLAVAVSCITLMFTIGAMAQTDAKHSAFITGFANNDASIKGDVTTQIITKVVDPIKLTLSRTPNDKITISVVGSASKIGSEGQNYSISQARADAVRSVLLEQFPADQFSTITINPGYSNGNEANARMAKVSWNVMEPIPAPQPHRSIPMIVVKIGGGVVAILLIAILLRKRREPEGITNGIRDNLVSMPSPKKEDIRTARIVTNDGSEYVANITYKDGERGVGFYTGCPAPNNFRKSLSNAKEAVKNALENPLYQPAIEQLITEGSIKIKIRKAGGSPCSMD